MRDISSGPALRDEESPLTALDDLPASDLILKGQLRTKPMPSETYLGEAESWRDGGPGHQALDPATPEAILLWTSLRHELLGMPCLLLLKPFGILSVPHAHDRVLTNRQESRQCSGDQNSARSRAPESNLMLI